MDCYLQNVEVKVIDSKKNRSLIAKKSFAKDDTLFMEKPFVCSQFSWNQFYNYKACEYCMKPLETAEENVRRLAEDPTFKVTYLKECCETNKANHSACERCSIEYCCVDCKQSAFETYHQALCMGEDRVNPNNPLNVLLDTWRQIHLPPETTTIELIIKMIATMKQAKNNADFMTKLSNFECNLFNQQEQIPHKLLNEKYFVNNFILKTLFNNITNSIASKSQLENIRELTLELFNRHLYVKECEPWLTMEGFRRLFSLIGRNSQGIGTSPLSVWVGNAEELKTISKAEQKKLDKLIDKIYDKLAEKCGAFLNSEGSGLYELQSMINHSCRPNAEISFKSNNNVLTIVALEEIKPNQEVLISYLDECELGRSRHSRQKALRENYLFNCECDRCVAEVGQADETSDEELEEEDDEEDEEEAKDSDEMEN